MLQEGGCDHDLVKDLDDGDAQEVIAEHTLGDEEWTFLQQYEGALNRIYKLIVFMQHKRTISHDELFELMSTLEHLGQNFFLVYNDVSKGTGEQHAPNLRVRDMNVCVRDPGFEFSGDNDFVSRHKNLTEMKTLDEIRICRRICFRQLGKQVRTLLATLINTCFICLLTVAVYLPICSFN